MSFKKYKLAKKDSIKADRDAKANVYKEAYEKLDTKEAKIIHADKV